MPSVRRQTYETCGLLLVPEWVRLDEMQVERLKQEDGLLASDARSAELNSRRTFHKIYTQRKQEI